MGVLLLLRRVDRLVERALAIAPSIYGPDAASDPYRGLHITPDSVARLLAAEAGIPTFHAQVPLGEEPDAEAVEAVPKLAWLRQTFGLMPFDLDVLLIALAPELDLRYERLYAYLQDDVTRRRPSVDLALNLLCPTAEAKLERRTRFAPDAPLVREGLVNLVADPTSADSPLLSHYLQLDEQIVRLLLGERRIDSRLAPFCRLVNAAAAHEELLFTTELQKGLPALFKHAAGTGEPLRLYFEGPPGVGKRRAAEALAAAVDQLLLVADLTRFPNDADPGPLLRRLSREKTLLNAILYVNAFDAPSTDGADLGRVVLEALASSGGIAILAGRQPWALSGHGPAGVLCVPFQTPAFAQRRAWWTANLSERGVRLDDVNLDPLAARFALSPAQIAEAVASACAAARCRAAAFASNAQPECAPNEGPTLQDLMGAARQHINQYLGALGQKIEPVYTWDDIVLPEDVLAQLRELCDWIAQRQRVLGTWGFGHKLSRGKGANALFSGPSGTGKTMAAEIIANELSLDVYRIDLSGVVSKYIGETEKHLRHIFDAAEDANVILFFDEADALFGKRSEVRDSHDRYANLEISYLLQRMETYEGLAILATNLPHNIDEGFLRRLAFHVHFPFPDEASRRRIWAGIWPASTPLAADVDPELLARQFKLSGGSIKNIALAAAFLAASGDDAVSLAHVLHATQREHQKLGKVLSMAEVPGETSAGSWRS